MVNCNRQALLLPLGDGAEDSRLAEYLKRQRQLRVSWLIWPRTPEEDSPLSALTGAEQRLWGTEARLRLGSAACTLRREGDWICLEIHHGDKRLELRISPEDRISLQANQQEPMLLELEQASLRVFSDGTRLFQRPDLQPGRIEAQSSQAAALWEFRIS